MKYLATIRGLFLNGPTSNQGNFRENPSLALCMAKPNGLSLYVSYPSK